MMSAKEYLSQVYKLDHRIHLMELEAEEYRRLSLSLPGQDFTKPRVDHTPDNQAYFVKWLCKAIDKEKEIKEKMKELVVIKAKVMATIDKVENPDYRMVLKLRYIDSMQFPDVAKKMCWSLSTIKRYHKEALEVVKVPTEVA